MDLAEKEEIKKLVFKHETNITVLSDSIDKLVNSSFNTNTKLDDVITEISKQNVLAEKLSNIDINLKESFSRVYKRIEVVERNQDLDGCPVLKILQEKVHGDKESVDLQIKAINKRLEKNDSHKVWIVTVFIAMVMSAIAKVIFK